MGKISFHFPKLIYFLKTRNTGWFLSFGTSVRSDVIISEKVYSTFPVTVSPLERLMVAHETAAFINKSMRFVQVIYITGNYCFVPRFSLSHLYMLLCVSFPLNSKNFILFSSRQAFFVSWWASICCRFSDRRSWPANRLVLSVWILFFSFLLAVNFSA